MKQFLRAGQTSSDADSYQILPPPETPKAGPRTGF